MAKAEGDWDSALREYRARKRPNYDAACFHAQQCAEKYLKARLHEAGVSFPPTHNLTLLLELLAPVEPTWEVLSVDLGILAVYAVAFRYPGSTADRTVARDAIAACRRVREQARLALGIET